MKNKNNIKLISGDISIDDRGLVKFVNHFTFEEVKRFYHVENFSKVTIRAFHGHQKESKYIYVVFGSILIYIARLDNVKHPNKKQKLKKFILSAHKPQILLIPGGHAHGYKVLEENTNILFFSTSSLANSIKDDYRYPFDYWGKDIWKISNR